MLTGTHISIAGGYLNAVAEARRLNIDTMQIFTKNQRMWKEKTIGEAEGQAFIHACEQNGIKQVFSHAIYLISMASTDDAIAEKSLLSLAAELERCRVLGLTHTVLHPGFAGKLPLQEAGKLPLQEAIQLVGDRIKLVLKATAGNPVKILIENTAGQGSSIGGKIEHIGQLISSIHSKRVGLCIDTCHAFAAGYDIRNTAALNKFFQKIDNETGSGKLLCFHLNDSRGALGSRLDRHAHIGEGLLGPEPFRYIMQQFPFIPKVLETSKENGADERNLALLRQFEKS